MQSVSHILQGAPILPIVQADNVEQALAICAAVKQGGLKNVEVVRRTAAAFDCVAAIRAEFPDLLVGMGTLLTPQHVEQAKQAGSQFLVTPCATPTLLQAVVDSQLPAIPGTANGADVLLAYEFGFREMKFFPASLSGGTPMLKALGAVFNEVTFCPTGGISAQNLTDYLSLSNVFAAGGSWMIPAEMVKNQDWQGISQLCAAAVSLCVEDAA